MADERVREACWGSAVSQACLTDACLTDAFIGHVHLLDMSSYPPWAYISMLLSMLLLCFYGFRRCWPPLGMNLLFRKHAPRMRSSAMSTCHAPMSSSPPCAYQRHAFALCLRVSKMLYGTASQDQFGMPWARILLGFRCFASCRTDAFIGHVHLPCAYYVQLFAMRLLYARFCFVFTGFEDAVRHRLWGSIWHALGSNSACETAEPQQNSSPRHAKLILRGGAVQHLRNP